MSQRQSRIKALLTTYYALDEDDAGESEVVDTSIDSVHFDLTGYVRDTYARSSYEELVASCAALGEEVREFDSQVQSAVYSNYSRLVTASDTLKELTTAGPSLAAAATAAVEPAQSLAVTAASLADQLAAPASTLSKLTAWRTAMSRLNGLIELPERLEAALAVGDLHTAAEVAASVEDFSEYAHVPAVQPVASRAQSLKTSLQCRLIGSLGTDPTVAADAAEMFSTSRPSAQALDAFCAATVAISASHSASIFLPSPHGPRDAPDTLSEATLVDPNAGEATFGGDSSQVHELSVKDVAGALRRAAAAVSLTLASLPVSDCDSTSSRVAAAAGDAACLLATRATDLACRALARRHVAPHATAPVADLLVVVDAFEALVPLALATQADAPLPADAEVPAADFVDEDADLAQALAGLAKPSGHAITPRDISALSSAASERGIAALLGSVQAETARSASQLFGRLFADVRAPHPNSPDLTPTESTNASAEDPAAPSAGVQWSPFSPAFPPFPGVVQVLAHLEHALRPVVRIHTEGLEACADALREADPGATMLDRSFAIRACVDALEGSFSHCADSAVSELLHVLPLTPITRPSVATISAAPETDLSSLPFLLAAAGALLADVSTGILHGQVPCLISSESTPPALVLALAAFRRSRSISLNSAADHALSHAEDLAGAVVERDVTGLLAGIDLSATDDVPAALAAISRSVVARTARFALACDPDVLLEHSIEQQAVASGEPRVPKLLLTAIKSSSRALVAVPFTPRPPEENPRRGASALAESRPLAAASATAGVSALCAAVCGVTALSRSSLLAFRRSCALIATCCHPLLDASGAFSLEQTLDDLAREVVIRAAASVDAQTAASVLRDALDQSA
jgi:hypothetical protein